MTHLTDISRLLARHGSRRGLADHKWTVTLSSGREKPAFGGPYLSIGVVAALTRCTASNGTPRLAE